jgi:Tfp pilus assembly pilus retraction ATPase PilT
MEALVAKGSDLHLKVGSPPRMRVDGRLVVLDGPALTPEMAESLLKELIRPDLHEQFQRTNEADFAYSLSGVGRFRVNAFRQRGSVGLVLRRVQEGAMSIGEIDLFPPFQQRQVRLSLAAALRGIVGQRLVRRAGDGGRVAVFEVMANTGRTAEAIADPSAAATSPRSWPRAASTACRPSTSTSSPSTATA